MINNTVKRKIFPFVELNFAVIYKEAMRDILFTKLNDFKFEVENKINTYIEKDIVDKRLEKLSNLFLEISKEELSSNEHRIELSELFIEKLRDRYEDQAKSFISESKEYAKTNIYNLTYENIDNYTSLEIFPYEMLSKINLSFFEIVINVLEDDKEEYESLLENYKYDIIVENIFNKRKNLLKDLIKNTYSNSEYINEICEKIKKKILEFFAYELVPYLNEQWKSTINLESIVNNLTLEIKSGKHNKQLTEAKSTNEKCTMLNSNNFQQDSEQPNLEEQHFEIMYGEKCITYESLFGAYLRGAKGITIIEEHLQGYYQFDNLMQLCKLLVKIGDINRLHIITKNDKTKESFPIRNKLADLANSLRKHNIELTYNFSQIFHDREIICDNGWIIEIGRGLHIYNPPEDDNLSKFDTYFRTCRQTKVHIYKDIQRSSNYQIKPGTTRGQVNKIQKIERKIACGL
jgi:hypothetical protein